MFQYCKITVWHVRVRSTGQALLFWILGGSFVSTLVLIYNRSRHSLSWKHMYFSCFQFLAAGICFIHKTATWTLLQNSVLGRACEFSFLWIPASTWNNYTTVPIVLKRDRISYNVPLLCKGTIINVMSYMHRCNFRVKTKGNLNN